MKQTLMHILVALIVVSFVTMLVSFFFTLPQPLVIVDTVVLILSIVAFLLLDKKDDEE